MTSATGNDIGGVDALTDGGGGGGGGGSGSGGGGGAGGDILGGGGGGSGDILDGGSDGSGVDVGDSDANYGATSIDFRRLPASFVSRLARKLYHLGLENGAASLKDDDIEWMTRVISAAAARAPEFQENDAALWVHEIDASF